MSLHDQVADISFRGQFEKNSPQLYRFRQWIFPPQATGYQSEDFNRPKGRGGNDHPHSGWLGFYRHRRQKTGARSAPVVAGKTGCEAPGLENPI
jgi:hypothetical protein